MRPQTLSLPGVSLVLGLAALALRLPGLQDWPAWTDETAEIGTAMDIAFRGALPLVHSDSYRGPLWAYLLAGALRLAPHPALPRLFTAAVGAATVAAAALLAGRLAGRRAAWMTGLLAMTAFGPLVFFSHIAWSNHYAPLAVAVALLLSAPAVGLTGAPAPDTAWRPGPMAAAAVAWGAALQTHPAVAPALAGFAAWLAWELVRGRRGGAAFRQPSGRELARAIGVAALAGGLAMGPLVAHNLRAWRVSGQESSVDEAMAPDQPINRDLSPALYAANLAALVGQLGRAAAAGPPFEEGDPVPDLLVAVTDKLRPAATAIAALLLLASLALAARGRRELGLLTWPALATALLLPVINRSYLNFYDARYLGVLLLLAQITLGIALAGAGSPASRGGRVGALALLACLCAYPLVSAGAYVRRAGAAGRTNAALNAAARALTADRVGRSASAGGPVFIDGALRDVDLGGGGDPARALSLLLELSGDRAEVLRRDTLRWHLDQASPALWLVVAGGAPPAPPRWRAAELARGPGWRALRLDGAILPASPRP